MRFVRLPSSDPILMKTAARDPGPLGLRRYAPDREAAEASAAEFKLAEHERTRLLIEEVR